MWPAYVDKTPGKLAYWRKRPPGLCIVAVSDLKQAVSISLFSVILYKCTCSIQKLDIAQNHGLWFIISQFISHNKNLEILVITLFWVQKLGLACVIDSNADPYHRRTIVQNTYDCKYCSLHHSFRITYSTHFQILLIPYYANPPTFSGCTTIKKVRKGGVFSFYLHVLPIFWLSFFPLLKYIYSKGIS